MLLIFAHCKKESKDEIPPEIEVFGPASNQIYNMGDSIPVSFSVSDNLNIEFISVHLTDQNGIIVQGQYSLSEYNKGKNYFSSFLYPLIDVSLESGNYYIKISAGDGSSITSKNIPLSIYSPLLKQGYCIAFKRNNFQFESVYADTNFNLNSFQNCTYTSLPVAFMLSGKQKIYAVAGKNAEPLKTFDLSNFQLSNTEYSNANSQPYFTCGKEDNNYFYVGYYNDSVSMRYPSGNPVLSFSSGDPGNFPSEISILESSIGIQFLSKTGAINQFIVFDKMSGQSLCSYFNFNSNIRAFSVGNNKSILLEESGNGTNSLSMLNNITGTVLFLSTLPSGQIKDVVQIDVNTLLIAHSNGNLYQYQYNSNTVTPVWSNSAINKMVFSSSENLLYAVNATKIELFSKTSTGINFIQNYTFADTVCNVKIQFNR